MLLKLISTLTVLVLWRKFGILCQPPQIEQAFSCTSDLFQTGVVPKADLPQTLPTSTPHVYVAEINSNPRVLIYEPDQHPTIEKNGILPPKLSREATMYSAYRFQASRDDSDYNRTARMVILPYIRLPYKTFMNQIFECHVYNTSNVEFFVLEDFRTRFQKIRIPIHNQLVDGVERQYIHLPYLDQNNQLFTMQTWIILQHHEPEEHPIPEYGFFDLPQITPIKVPMNAHLIHRTIDIRSTSVVSANLMSDVHAKLAVNWIPGLCYQLATKGHWFKKAECNVQKWRIHGFWPNTVVRRINSANFQIVSSVDFDANIIDFWQNIVAGNTNEELFSRAWNKHGFHFFEKPRQYFKSTLHRYQDLRLNELAEKLATAGIVPSNTVYHRPMEFKSKVESLLPGNSKIKLVCTSGTNEITLLYEIQFCFRRDNKEHWTREDCDEESRCKDYLIFPQSYGLFPYFLLSVYRLPAQIYRTRQLATVSYHVDTEEQYESWYIHSLCPAKQMYYLLSQYIRNVHYLVNNWMNFEPSMAKYGQYWPHLTKPFYRGKYTQCGLPLRTLTDPKFRGMKRYFDSATQMFIDLKTEKWTNDPYLNRLDETLNTIQVKNTLKKHVTTVVSLQCIEVNGRHFLTNVGICYDNEKIQRIDCPQSLDFIVRPSKIGNYTNCGENLVIASSPEKIL